MRRKIIKINILLHNQIGAFIHQRNISDGNERRSTVKTKQIARTKNVKKALRMMNLIITMEMSSFSHSLRISMCSGNMKFGYLQSKIPHVRPSRWLLLYHSSCAFFPIQDTYRTVHLFVGSVRISPEIVVMLFTLIKQLHLLLSGDVEVNPGPLGQHTEGRARLFQ